MQKKTMNKHETINYIEFPAENIQETKQFFTQVFNWNFEDFGPEYAAFSDQGINGGFFKSTLKANTSKGSALIVFYSDNLEATYKKIEHFGGKIIKPIFSFPGGRRFHFTEPSGNEFAVWSDKSI